MQFADDIVTVSENLKEFETMIQELKNASAVIGLKINFGRTKVFNPETPMSKNVIPNN